MGVVNPHVRECPVELLSDLVKHGQAETRLLRREPAASLVGGSLRSKHLAGGKREQYCRQARPKRCLAIGDVVEIPVADVALQTLAVGLQKKAEPVRSLHGKWRAVSLLASTLQ